MDIQLYIQRFFPLSVADSSLRCDQNHRGLANKHGYISTKPTEIQYKDGGFVLLYLIYVVMDEDYNVEIGGARLGDGGLITIVTNSVNKGDALYQKLQSSEY